MLQPWAEDEQEAGVQDQGPEAAVDKEVRPDRPPLRRHLVEAEAERLAHVRSPDERELQEEHHHVQGDQPLNCWRHAGDFLLLGEGVRHRAALQLPTYLNAATPHSVPPASPEVQQSTYRTSPTAL